MMLSDIRRNRTIILTAVLLMAAPLIGFSESACTFKLGDGRFVQLTLPDGWAYCSEGMGDTQVIVYYGTPGLTAIGAAQQGFDAIRVNAYSSAQTTFSDENKTEFFKVEGIPGIKDTVRIAERDDTLAVLCELNQMYRITGTRLVDGHKLFADEYVRGGMLEGEKPEDYLQTRCGDYLAILDSARVFTDPARVQGTPVIELRSSAGYQKIEKTLIFIFSNLKWIGLGFILLIIGIVQLIRHKLKKRKCEQASGHVPK